MFYNNPDHTQKKKPTAIFLTILENFNSKRDGRQRPGRWQV